MPSEAEIAWAAGLFEGEGSIFFSKVGLRRKGGGALALGMTDEDVVRRFARIVDCGSVRGPINRGGRANSHWKPMWDWKVYDRYEVCRVLDLFFPFFGERRQEKAMAILEKVGMSRGPNAEQVECSRGHPLIGDNLVLAEKHHTKANGEQVTYTVRRCRICRIEQARARDERRRAPKTSN